MQVKFELVTYNEESDKFELDETVYHLVLDDEQAKTYELLKDGDLHLYNWFKESDFFLNWIREEVYPDSIGKKFAICDIDDISFRRFYFFKVTSGDVHYEYFMKLFDIFEESDWKDREAVGEEILEKLPAKRKELVMEIEEDIEENLESENDTQA
jgi:hypothetical protein